MRIGALQLRVGDERDTTLALVADIIDEAAGGGVEVLLLPELFSVPFVQPEIDPDYFGWAEGLNGPSNAMVAARSQQHGMTIISSVFERSAIPGVYHNTCCTYVSGELTSTYRKSHLPFSNGFPEKFYFRPGDAAPKVVETPAARLGTVICYERHFPELSRLAALGGAEVLLVPVASASAAMREVFQLELRAHGIFNGMFVVCANRIGKEQDKEYFGTSGIYGPNGEVLSVASDHGENELVVADVNLEDVREARHARPFLRDRRPELYDQLRGDRR